MNEVVEADAEPEIEASNDQLVLVTGYSSTGKSASLRNIRNPEKWFYLNTESGKRLPFRSKFQSFRITDPYEVHEAFDVGASDPNVEGIILDSLTFLMDMYETMYVLNAANTMKAWGDFAQFYKQLMQKVTVFGRPTIITAHTLDVYDETTMTMKTSVPIKGSLKNQGIEAYFSTVVSAKRMLIKDLKGFESDLLNITDEDKELGFKHCFQTRLTAKTTGERIRSPMALFNKSQTFMDNDVQILLDHLKAFYEG